MRAHDILLEFENQGWDDNSIIVLLCEYIDNQKSNDTFYDFLQTKADEENNWEKD